MAAARHLSSGGERLRRQSGHHRVGRRSSNTAMKSGSNSSTRRVRRQPQVVGGRGRSRKRRAILLQARTGQRAQRAGRRTSSGRAGAAIAHNDRSYWNLNENEKYQVRRAAGLGEINFLFVCLGGRLSRARRQGRRRRRRRLCRHRLRSAPSQ
jgi:hypothetical protein